VRAFCGRAGVLKMQTSALFGAKTSDFSKFMVCPHGQGGGDEPVRTFFGQGERGSQFFADSCGRPLWTAPYRFEI